MSFSNIYGGGIGGIAWGNQYPVYTIGPGPGPKYVPDTEPPDCSNPIPDAQELAEKAAEYITENGGQFGAAIVSAAQGALNNWRGTGLGVAASADFAMEFLAALGIGCTLGEFLIILAVVGLTVATAIELWKCFHH
jgi:hypothetical protein